MNAAAAFSSKQMMEARSTKQRSPDSFAELERKMDKLEAQAAQQARMLEEKIRQWQAIGRQMRAHQCAIERSHAEHLCFRGLLDGSCPQLCSYESTAMERAMECLAKLSS